MENRGRIYNDIDSFDNAKIVGDGIFEVYGLDGTYRYDINKIYNEYNNKSIDSRSKLKAKLLDDMALEDINGKKELVTFRSGFKNVIIPKECEKILGGSINIIATNEKVVIRDNIKKISSKMFKADKKDKYINFTGLKEIEIGCKDELTFNILNSLKNLWGNGIRAKITFSRDVTMLDVVIHHLVMCDYGYLTRIGMEGNTKDRGLDKRSISFIRKFLETSKISKADSYRHGRSMNFLDELELKLKKIEHYTNAREGEFKELGIYDELLQIVKGIREEKNNRLRELGEI